MTPEPNDRNLRRAEAFRARFQNRLGGWGMLGAWREAGGMNNGLPLGLMEKANQQLKVPGELLALVAEIIAFYDEWDRAEEKRSPSEVLKPKETAHGGNSNGKTGQQQQPPGGVAAAGASRTHGRG